MQVDGYEVQIMNKDEHTIGMEWFHDIESALSYSLRIADAYSFLGVPVIVETYKYYDTKPATLVERIESIPGYSY